MHIPFFQHHATIPEIEPSEYPLEPGSASGVYTSEGSEFLDDAIRMKEQPLIRTEESIAAGSPEYLL